MISKANIRFFMLCCLAAGAQTLVSCSEQEELGSVDEKVVSPCKVTLDAVLDPSEPESTGKKKIKVAEDTAEGLKTTWESNDRLQVMFWGGSQYKIAELNVEKANGRTATFSGTVESSADAQAFRTGTLYVVNDNADDNIHAVGQDGKLQVTVDLSGQDGTVGNIAKYDLLYATGSANSPLHFKHEMSVVRLDLELDPSVTELAACEFIYTPDETSAATSIFAGKTTLSFPGTKGADTTPRSFFTLGGKVSLNNGKASVYVVVPECKNASGTLSIEAKSANRSFRRHLQISDKTFDAGKVVAKTVKMNSTHAVPRVMDYLYSDGTWGPLEYFTNKVPVALVISNFTSPTDRAKGYTHGYAMALRDAAWPVQWGPEDVDYEFPNLFDDVSATAPLTMLNGLDGLTLSTEINNKYLKQFTWENHYDANIRSVTCAIPACMEYGGPGWRLAYTDVPCNVPTPPNTSGWFLPSVGQWFLAFSNIAGLDPDKLEVVRDNYGQPYRFDWVFSSSEEMKGYLRIFYEAFNSYNNNILKRYFEERRIPQSVFYIPTTGQIDWYLWAADEATSGGSACCVHINDTRIGFTSLYKTMGRTENNGYAARAVIAF